MESLRRLLASPDRSRAIDSQTAFGVSRGSTNLPPRFICFPPTCMDAKKSKAKESGNQPVRVFRTRGISVSVFENQSKDGRPFYKAAIQRSYRDEDGNYQTTNSFSSSDLSLLSLLACRAFEFILDQTDGSGEETEE